MGLLNRSGKKVVWKYRVFYQENGVGREKNDTKKFGLDILSRMAVQDYRYSLRQKKKRNKNQLTMF